MRTDRLHPRALPLSIDGTARGSLAIGYAGLVSVLGPPHAEELQPEPFTLPGPTVFWAYAFRGRDAWFGLECPLDQGYCNVYLHRCLLSDVVHALELGPLLEPLPEG